MGSLIVKIDKPTSDKLKQIHHYSDIDVFHLSIDPNNMALPMVYDVEAVKQSVRNILMWRTGESVLHPEFGHNLHHSMYTQLTSINKDAIGEEIKRAIEENEPRVEIQGVAIKNDDEDDENNTIHVKVIYTVKGDESSNKPKIVEETTISRK